MKYLRIATSLFLFFLLFSHCLYADDIQNSNTTVHTTGIIDVEAILAKRKEVLENFKAEFNLTDQEAKKVIHRLRKIFLKDKEALHVVDIFIAETVDGVPIQNAYVPNYEFSIKFDTSPIKLIFKQDGITRSPQEAKIVLAQEREALKLNREQQHLAREANLEKIIKIIRKDITPEIEAKLYEAAAKGVPYVTLELSAKSIKKMLKKEETSLFAIDVHTQFKISSSAYSEGLAAWEIRLDNYLNTTYVNQSQEYHTPNHDGSDIGIYYSDSVCPLFDEFDDLNTTFDGYDTPPSERYTVTNSDGNYIETICTSYNGSVIEKCEFNSKNHTRMITGILATVSPQANILCNSVHLTDTNETNYSNSGVTVYEQVLPTEEIMLQNQVQVESYSLNKYDSVIVDDNDSRDYFPMDRVFDHHAYTYDIPIFISAGNERTDNPSSDVVSPAKAFNVITMGNYGLDANLSPIWHETSSYRNPLLGGVAPYQKPELSAPGTKFYGYQKIDYSGNPAVEYDDSGTSFATPFAAAMAANLMSAIQDYEPLGPEYLKGTVIKATMMALALDSVQVEGKSSIESRTFVGEGGVDLASSLVEVDYKKSNDFFSDIGGRQCLSNWNTITLEGSLKVRFVTVWFNDITNAEVTQIPNSYSMEVIDPSGEHVAEANISNQGYQLIDFTLRDVPEGNYTARICKIQNDGKEVRLGFAVSKVPYEYTPPHPPAPGVMETIISYLLD